MRRGYTSTTNSKKACFCVDILLLACRVYLQAITEKIWPSFPERFHERSQGYLRDDVQWLFSARGENLFGFNHL